MKTKTRQTDAGHQWIRAEQLRAGDSVDLKSEHALVIMVEQVDQKRVLVAYEGVDQVDYPVGTELKIRTRTQIPAQDTSN